jgi:hypothetical protein
VKYYFVEPLPFNEFCCIAEKYKALLNYFFKTWLLAHLAKGIVSSTKF